MVVCRVEQDRFLAVIGAAEFVEKDPVTFDVAVAHMLQLASERMVLVFCRKSDALREHHHRLVQLRDIFSRPSDPRVIAAKSLR